MNWTKAYRPQTQSNAAPQGVHGPHGMTGVQGASSYPTGVMNVAEIERRLSSFIERYVVERAGSFRAGFEKEDGFTAIQDANTLYELIEARTHDSLRKRTEQMLSAQYGQKGAELLPTTPAYIKAMTQAVVDDMVGKNMDVKSFVQKAYEPNK